MSTRDTPLTDADAAGVVGKHGNNESPATAAIAMSGDSTSRDGIEERPLWWRRIWRRRWVRRTLFATVLSCVAVAGTGVYAWFAFPYPIHVLDQWPQSPRVTDRRGGPLLALVGHDDQWRYPIPLEQMSPWLVNATLAVEDARFREHGGVDLQAVLRAVVQNIGSGRIVSGASTISMQVARMTEPRRRSFSNKAVQTFRALQLEQLRDKDAILETYLNIAPYGGNLRGAAVAAERYFGKQVADLSLAEAALLAGLPQSPERLRPDRHSESALARRHRVLERMLETGMITAEEMAAADAEPLRLAVASHPLHAPHAAWMALSHRRHGGQIMLDPDVQREVETLSAAHVAVIPYGCDLAVVVIDVERAALAALVGSADWRDPTRGQVNAALARRSPGSTLKTFVYAAAFEAHRLAPNSELFDVPIEVDGWRPRNYDEEFSGSVRASDALRRSLNIPAIWIAYQLGMPQCTAAIEAAGVRLSDAALRRAGLSAVVGGCEVTLLDLTNGYATIARGGEYRPMRLFVDEADVPGRRVFSTDVCAMIDQILDNGHRNATAGVPGDALQQITTPCWYMWKTGTSAGNRDAFAVGHNGRYAVGVWVGRFRGSGDTRLTGKLAAEPLLRALFESALLRQPVAPADASSLAALWRVQRPFASPPALKNELRITRPSDRAEFIAIDGNASVYVETNNTEPCSWFANGRPVTPDERGRLILTRGNYELRCVDAHGSAQSVTVTVR